MLMNHSTTVPPDAAPASTLSRLDTGTIWNRTSTGHATGAYRVLVRNYGDGLVEATAAINIPNRRRKPRGGETPLQTPERTQENQDRALRRARATIRQSIMAAQLDHLLTLTYRENQECPRTAWRHFARFLRLLRKSRKGAAFPFMAVLEKQKRGAIHIHAAVHGYQDVRLLRRLWHEAIGSTNGNIDVQFFRQRLPRLARYLSKYISKDISTGHIEGHHRYKRSRGLEIPAAVVFLPFTAIVDVELLNLFEARGATVRFHLNHLKVDGPKWLWACSW